MKPESRLEAEPEKKREENPGSMGRKCTAILLTILFGIVLCLAGIAVCVKPICARVIHEAFLGRALALRVNDVVWERYEITDINKGLEFQRFVEEHVQLDHIAARYLDAIADYQEPDGFFREPDVEKEMTLLNLDILRKLEDVFGIKLEENERQAVLEELTGVERQVTERLNELPYYIGNFGKIAVYALKIYGFLVSWQCYGVLAAVLAALGLGLYRIEEQKGRLLRRGVILCVTEGIFFAILFPVFVRQVSYIVTNRLIGRAWEIDTFAFRYAGVGFFVTAVILLLAVTCSAHRVFRS